MTKAELLEKLENIPNDAEIILFIHGNKNQKPELNLLAQYEKDNIITNDLIYTFKID